MDATVHWHGLRLENRYDGTHETQAPMPVGGRFSARVTFPDPGVYWYHPHIREDYGQEMGLYGNVLVEPADPDYWPPVHRELVLTLDDILHRGRQGGAVQPLRDDLRGDGPLRQRAAGGGEPDLALTAQLGRGRALLLDQHGQHAGVQGQAARRADEARRRRQRPRRARAVRRRGRAGALRARRRRRAVRPGRRAGAGAPHARTGSIGWPRSPSARSRPSRRCASSSRCCAPTPSMAAERERLAPYLEAEPDKTLAFIAEMDMDAPEVTGRSSTRARCTRRSSAKSPAAARSAA